MHSVVFALQSVIDGDLCEYFNSLDSSKRRSIAEELDRTPAEVKSKLCCCCCFIGSLPKWCSDLRKKPIVSFFIQQFIFLFIIF